MYRQILASLIICTLFSLSSFAYSEHYAIPDTNEVDSLKEDDIDWQYIDKVLDQDVGTYTFQPFRRPVYSGGGEYIKDDLFILVGNTKTGESKIFFFNATNAIVEWQEYPFQLPLKPFD